MCRNRRLVGWLRNNATFVLLFGLGATLRLVVWFAYKPAILVLGDTAGYLAAATGHRHLPTWRPALYSFFLRPLIETGLASATAIQHLLALLTAVALYAVLRRLALHPVLAALGTAPLLLDGFQLNLEQHILAETVFEALAVAALVLLMWWVRPPLWSYPLAGVLLGAAGITRFVGLGLIVPALAYALVRRVRWTLIGGLTLGWLVVIGAYASYVQSVTGSFGLTNRTGFVLYGKVATFADCENVDLPPLERQLCPAEPLGERQKSYSFWAKGSPLHTMQIPDGVDKGSVAQSFARRFILRQPLDYGRVVALDFLRFFAWRRPTELEPIRAARWEFFVDYERVPARSPIFRRSGGSPPEELGLSGRFDVREPLARFLRRYQRFVYPAGPLLTLFVLLAFAGTVLGRGPGERDRRWGCALLTLSGCALYLFPAAFGFYHFRYVIPGVPLLGAGGAVGAALLHARFGAPRGRAARDEPEEQETDTSPDRSGLDERAGGTS